MTTFVESLRRLFVAKKVTVDYINNLACLNEEEKAFITAEIEDYETAYKIVTGEVE